MIDGTDDTVGRSPPATRSRDLSRRSLVSGVAVLVPLAVTLLVLGFVLNLLSQVLDPLVGVVLWTTPTWRTDPVLIELAALASLLVLVLVVGALAEFGPGEGRIAAGFDSVMSSIPGVGSVYSSFDEMSELLLDSDTDSFQEVKLVEYPNEGSYTMAFKTADSSGLVEEATGHGEMVTLFLPMAPNPMMGGFVVHVSTDRVIDVDMTVEEGIRAVVTSGVTAGETTDTGLSAGEMRALGGVTPVDRRTDPRARTELSQASVAPADRQAAYDRAVDPTHAGTPTRVARRAEDRPTGGGTLPDGTRPAEASRGGVIGETAGEPAERADRPDRHRDRTVGRPAERDDDGGR
jgi:uncharacterized membrane protein